MPPRLGEGHHPPTAHARKEEGETIPTGMNALREMHCTSSSASSSSSSSVLCLLIPQSSAPRCSLDLLSPHDNEDDALSPPSPGPAADCCMGRSRPPPFPPSPSATADYCLGRRQKAPASTPSPARRLIVIWVVWPSYLPPKAAADCRLGGRVILTPPSLDAADCHLGGVVIVSPPPQKRQLIVVWVVALSSIPWCGG